MVSKKEAFKLKNKSYQKKIFTIQLFKTNYYIKKFLKELYIKKTKILFHRDPYEYDINLKKIKKMFI